MTLLLISVLAALCTVFGVSAASKLTGSSRRRAFVGSLRAPGLLPKGVVVPVAVVLSCAESVIAVGTGLALYGVLVGAPWAGRTAALVLFAAFTLLTVLTAGIVIALRRRSTVPCACFGVSDRPLSWRHVLRNGLMVSLAAAGSALAAAASLAVVDLFGAGAACGAGLIGGLVLIRIDEILELFVPSDSAARAQVRS